MADSTTTAEWSRMGLAHRPRDVAGADLRFLSELIYGKSGAGGRTRTDMSVTSPDFESGAYTNFATPALQGEDDKASVAESQLGPTTADFPT